MEHTHTTLDDAGGDSVREDSLSNGSQEINTSAKFLGMSKAVEKGKEAVGGKGHVYAKAWRNGGAWSSGRTPRSSQHIVEGTTHKESLELKQESGWKPHQAEQREAHSENQTTTRFMT